MQNMPCHSPLHEVKKKNHRNCKVVRSSNSCLDKSHFLTLIVACAKI